MSAINLNMQDNVVKSSLVQQIQERDTDINRSSNQMHDAFAKEMARKSHEVVTEVEHTENHGINADNEGDEGRGGKQKKQHRRNPDDPDDPLMEGWSMGPDDDGKPHSINIIA